MKWTSPFYSANVQLGEWMGIKGCLSNQQAMVTLQRMCRSRFHVTVLEKPNAVECAMAAHS